MSTIICDFLNTLLFSLFKYYTNTSIDVLLMLNTLKDEIMGFFLSSIDSVLLCDYIMTFCGWTTIYLQFFLYNAAIMNILVYILCCNNRAIVSIGCKLYIYIFFPLLGNFRLFSKNYTPTKTIQNFTLTNSILVLTVPHPYLAYD